MNKTPVSSEPVALIGMGCLFPQAENPNRYWHNILAGVDAITEVPPSHWQLNDYFHDDPSHPDHTYARRGGFLSPVDFPPLDFGVTPNSLEAIDTTQLLGLLVAKQALDDAGYNDERTFNRNRINVVLGVTGTLPMVIPLGARLGHPHWRRALANAGVADEVADKVIAEIGEAYVGWQEDSFPGLLGNVVAGRIANRLNLGGTNCVVDAACASSLSAMHLALLELWTGRCDMAVSGGMDTFNDIFMYMCFSKTPALSRSGDAKPFDAGADGTILGEGLGCVILKRLADAERDGDKIYAVLRSIGTSSDGKGHAIYAPSAAGQTKALRQAYSLAGISPNTIELVEAHGTGTKAGDTAEVTALTEVYRETQTDGRWCALGSVKSQIGHTKAAAGAAGLIKAALALHHKVLPPTIKVSQPNEVLASADSPFYVNCEKRPWVSRGDHPRRAAVSSFGFGGSNYHCVLEEYRSEKTDILWDGDVRIVSFAAASRDELRQQVDAWFTRGEARNVNGVMGNGDVHRLVLVTHAEQDLPRLRQAIEQRLATADTFWSLPDGVYYGMGNVPGKLGVLFPGQGAQYPGMGRDLACQFPQLLRLLSDANQVAGSTSLIDQIYPPTSFTSEEKQHHEAALRATDVAQPAIGVLSLGMWRILQYFGVKTDAAAGHSFGELTALCAAGHFSTTEFLRLAALRGRLMADASSGQGGMVAVSLPAGDVEHIVRREHIDVVIANLNAPRQTVVSGSRSALDALIPHLQAANIAHRRLPVGAAFHSPDVAEVAEPFHAALRSTAWSSGSLPVYANTTGRVYSDHVDEGRHLLAHQLAKPVRFVDVIENMYADGVRTFVEVGPGTVLTGLVRSILDDKPHHSVAVDASRGKHAGQRDLAKTLALLAALGYPVDLAKWSAACGLASTAARGLASAADDRPQLTVSLCGANYRKPQSASTPAVSQNGTAHHEEAKPQAVEVKPQAVEEAKPQAAPVPPETSPIAPVTTSHAEDIVNPTPNMHEHTLKTLQQIAEQTADLHRQFLEGQDRVLQVLQTLLQPNTAPATVAAPPTIPSPPVVEPVAAPIVEMPPTPPPVEPIAATNGHVVTEPPKQDVDLASVLLAIVAEKTGYPTEMLALDMEMDADLGIDSIKRVEILSAVQEQVPELPPVPSEQLGALRTLGDVVAILEASAGTDRNVHPTVSAETGTDRNVHPTAPAKTDVGWTFLSDHAATNTPDDGLEKILLETVADKTGYPADMLDLDMEMDSDLGIDSIKRVEILSALQEQAPHLPTVASEQLGSLHTLRDVVDYLQGTEAAPSKMIVAEVAAAVAAEEAKPQAVVVKPTTLQRYVLTTTALPNNDTRRKLVIDPSREILIVDEATELSNKVANRLNLLGFQARIVAARRVLSEGITGDIGGVMVLSPAAGTTDEDLLNTVRAVQHLGSALRNNSGDTMFLTAAHLDGAFGLATGQALANPLSGGLAGLVKTTVREWPEIQGKAVDVSPALDVEEAALALVSEFFLAGPSEVALTPDDVRQLGLQQVAHEPSTHFPLERGDVVLITGGARGVTAEAALALARRCAPTMILLGRSPVPPAEAPALQSSVTEQDIKQVLIQSATAGTSPRDIAEQTRKILAAREIRGNLQRLRETGALVEYRSVDVRDAAAVERIVDEARDHFGPIRGLVHGAGVIADRVLADKTVEQFRAVYETKVSGLRNLLSVLENDPLRVLALFSSSSGRFGRQGQVDYAIANEVLNKLAQREARRRRDCKVVSLNWGPWAGGMVDASLHQRFLEEGLGPIPLADGAEFLVQELAQSANAVEVVVLGAESRLPENLSHEKTVPVNGTPPHETSPTRPRGHATVAIGSVPAFTRTLSVEEQPFLQSHVLGGRAVVPVVLMIEWLAHGALHVHPGLTFHGFEELRVFRGIKLDADDNYHVEIVTSQVRRDDGLYRVPVAIHGRDDVNHASATIILSNKLPDAPPPQYAPAGEPYNVPMEQIYQTHLFHGIHFQGIKQITGIDPTAIHGRVQSAPPPRHWIRQPLRSRWSAEPLVLDCSFQMVLLWTRHQHDLPALPTFIRHYRQYQRSFPADDTRVQVRITEQAGPRVSADIDYHDAGGNVVARMLGFECAMEQSLRDSFRQNQLPALVT